MQKIVTDGKGLNTPMAKLIMSVIDVIVIETAASLSVIAIRSGTLVLMEVLLQAANITNVSSIPIPKKTMSSQNTTIIILLCKVSQTE